MGTTIGNLTLKDDGSLEGTLATLMVTVPIAIVPNGRKTKESEPDFRVVSRRNGFEWISRSRSRWNGVLTEHGSSSRSRPRVSYDRTASGDSVDSSSARIRSANAPAIRPATSMSPG